MDVGNSRMKAGNLCARNAPTQTDAKSPMSRSRAEETGLVLAGKRRRPIAYHMTKYTYSIWLHVATGELAIYSTAYEQLIYKTLK